MQIPVPLIRDMDVIIAKGISGYATRTEFIVDAIQERIFELTFEFLDGSNGPLGSTEVEISSSSADEEVKKLITQWPGQFSEAPPLVTRIPIQQGFTVEAGADRSNPEGRPLFGLHNRDFPSLWALSRLAMKAHLAPISVEEFYATVLNEAWAIGGLLAANEKATGKKFTALFPTNSEKRKSAETGFRMFAIGDYRPQSDGTFITSGPLFEWRVAALIGSTNDPMIGLTSCGWELLSLLAGTSVDEPHPLPAATAFLAHLAEYSPADHSGFVMIIDAIGIEGSTRRDVLEHVARAWPNWTDNEVSTNSAGYIARAREWGLVQPKQYKSRYQLTQFGKQYLSTTMNGAQS